MKKKPETKKTTKEAKPTKPVAPAVAEAAEPLKKAVRVPELLRGMRDVMPAEQNYWRLVFDKVRALADTYGFERIDTPILEEAALFSKAIGRDSDIVEKEMYLFEDLDGAKLVLRPEATASIARAYLNHGLFTLPQPIKLWYWGPMFRHERPQSGRYRQFHQFGFEMIGEASPVSDAMIILIAYNFYQELGVPVTIQINSLGCTDCRPAYREELLQYYRSHRGEICENCKKRLQRNPWRVLDCKEPTCQPVKENAPKAVDSLCDDCRAHFMGVLEYLDDLNLPYLLTHTLVRGLDYYTRTVFEIYAVAPEGQTAEGVPAAEAGRGPGQTALGGGGRYDLLIETLGGRPTPATGFAHGIERCVNKLRELSLGQPAPPKVDIYMAQLGEAARRKAFILFERFRKEGLLTAEGLSKSGLRAQLEAANKLGVRYAIVIGQKEVQDDTAIIRDMESGIQEIVPFAKVIQEVKKKLTQGA